MALSSARAALPLSAGALAAMRYVAYADPKRLYSFKLEEEDERCMAYACQTYVIAQMERGFATLDFYHSLFSANEPPFRR